MSMKGMCPVEPAEIAASSIEPVRHGDKLAIGTNDEAMILCLTPRSRKVENVPEVVVLWQYPSQANWKRPPEYTV
jgi:hypothetical protein